MSKKLIILERKGEEENQTLRAILSIGYDILESQSAFVEGNHGDDILKSQSTFVEGIHDPGMEREKVKSNLVKKKELTFPPV